jgi:hypothetical protein
MKRRTDALRAGHYDLAESDVDLLRDTCFAEQADETHAHALVVRVLLDALRLACRCWQSGGDVRDLHPQERVHGIGVLPVVPEHRHLEGRDARNSRGLGWSTGSRIG